MKLLIKENKQQPKISDNLNYHLEHKKTLNESIFRLGSDAWVTLINETRSLYDQGFLMLEEDEKGLIDSLAGQYGNYKGEGMAQVFFHYVNQNGPYKHHAYDNFLKTTGKKE